ncbi:MAG: FecR domain-containing protein, partial [Gammaproteobacteria bacterium]|nr:FecR domain-containing protein [Gammaproteobacteria bacterium]
MMIKTNMMCRNFIKNSLLLCVLLFAGPASANVGKIVYGYGNNFALDSDGNRRVLKKGSIIKEGDTLVTAKGRLQLRLIDGGFVSIYPNSEYKIEKYKFSGAARNSKKANVKEVAESKEDRGFFSLLKGAARQVTGLLGRTHNKNFRFRTSIATIGIRGTGFFVRLCQADCFDENGDPLQDGMYVKNNTGIITMATTVGEVSLAQGQSAFAASSVDSPQQTIQAPMVYNLVTKDIEQYDFDEKANITDCACPAIATVTPIPTPTPTPTPTLNITKLEYVANNDLLYNAINAMDVANGVNTISVVGDAIKGFSGTTAAADMPMEVVFDKSLATKVEFGSDAALGVLWNRWEGGYSYTENGQTLASLDNNIHLIGAE